MEKSNQHIPKGQGKLRPLGIPVLEDKLLQVAATQILLAIYEVGFLPCSYGYRPGLKAQDAIKALTDQLQWGGHHLVVEADIKGFFDPVQWDWLERMLVRFQVPRPCIVETPERNMPCQTELSFCQRLMNFLKPGTTPLANASVS
jgi:hypothetical protein